MPLAQTFLVSQPTNGVSAVYLTSVDLYFQSSDPVFGVELQIRTTENGAPTAYTVPNGTAYLTANQVSTSTNASVPTTFTFATPIVIQTNQQYALVVLPSGGNPNYTLWTGVLSANDITTGVPIYNNNQLGSLFLSSNDLNYVPSQLESMKYTLRVANFTGSSGTAVYRNSNSDFFKISSVVGTFTEGEKIVVSNSVLSLARVSLSGANTFTVGEYVYQTSSGSSPNTAVGTVYTGSNSSVLLLSNVTGSFVNSGNTTIVGTSSSKSSTITASVNSISATASSNTVTVPFITYTDFANGNYIFVSTNTFSNAQMLQIVGNNATTNTLILSANVKFSDSNTIIGRVKSDGALYGYLSSITKLNSNPKIILDSVTSNAASNFVDSGNSYLIGLSSGATSLVVDTRNRVYDSITSQFTQIVPTQTSATWSFSGTSNTYVLDTSNTVLQPDLPYEFIDEERTLVSRSKEQAALSGASSLHIQANLNTSNNLISPYINNLRTTATMTYNVVAPDQNLQGYAITGNNIGIFGAGTIITQSNSTVTTSGTVITSNSSTILVSNIVSSNVNNIGAFIANGSATVSNGSSSVVATTVSYFNEANNAAIHTTSRYISKNVILATGQNSEDLLVYLAAYRPPGTNLRVYGKFSSTGDSNPFANNDWSRLPETSSPALQSSLVNQTDYVQLQYDLPSSVQVYGSGVTTSNANPGTGASANVVLGAGQTTAQFSLGQFVYISDTGYTGASNTFNVRQVIAIPNANTLVLSSNLTIGNTTTGSTNAAIGIIPGLESQAGAFKYANNSGIARYVTYNDVPFDTFINFAVKIVMVANASMIVPRVSNMRAIAVQV